MRGPGSWAGPPRHTQEGRVIVANYATQGFCTDSVTIVPGAKRDSVTDSTLIAKWSSDFTTTAPAAGVGNVTGVLAGYLAVYPNGPQVS